MHVKNLSYEKNLIYKVARSLLPIFINCNQAELEYRNDKKGLVLVIQEITDDYLPVFLKVVCPLGEIPSSTLNHEELQANEKIDRMMKHKHAYASFESENTNLEQHGGAIKAGNFLLSASGLTPLLEQKFLILVAIMAHVLEFKGAEAINNATLGMQAKWVPSI